MTIQKLVLRCLLPIVLLLVATAPALADSTSRLPNKFVLTFKSGYLDLVDDTQFIAGQGRRFDESSNVWAVEGEWRGEPGENVSFGGEILHFNNRFKRETSTGNNWEDKMQTHALLLKSKYFLGPSEYWQPYVGLGVGLVNVYDYDGPIEGTANGIGVQGVAGMQFRSARVGIRLEYMYFHSELDDDKGDSIDVSTQGVLLGMSFYLGRRPR